MRLPPLAVDNTAEIVTPALVVFSDTLDANLRQMVAIAGHPDRLRPHAKTHKLREVVLRQLALGITRHKCATIAEAEMLSDCGVRDIVLAYPPVGANIGRVVRFRQSRPHVELGVLCDDPRPAQELAAATAAAATTVEVLLDVDVGQRRTGIPPGPQALDLYQLLCHTPGLTPGGLHVYDGHNHQVSRIERGAAVHAVWDLATRLRHDLQQRSCPVPRIVAGGTGSFPIFAEISDPSLELSPGTCVFHDAGYVNNFPDLPFVPAALLLTRVISRPSPDRVTFDLGYKACASDPLMERRVIFPHIPDARIVLHNEEHLVIETQAAARFRPGDEQWAVPWHICPTTALHRQVYVVEHHHVNGTWDVVARDRVLTI